MILRPQPGPQTDFLSSDADIVIYGGAAGGGKTYGLLLEATRHLQNSQFGAVVFRRLATQITGEGGLWDTAMTIYPNMGAKPFLSPRYGFRFPTGPKLTFAHLQYNSDVLSWQGTQIALISFDELTHFNEYQFWYILSRNRSTSGVRPYVRATCNPDADSWVAELIKWWIDQNTGYAIPQRSGVVRYFTRINGQFIWGNSYDEVLAQMGRLSEEDDPSHYIKSLTFIPSKLDDNAILMRCDPGYRASLLALPNVERERLLNGNWKIRPQAGLVFPSTCIDVIPAVPADVSHWVRAWDLAATEPSEVNPSPDGSASVLMGRRENGRFVVADASYLRQNAHVVRQAIKNAAVQDRMDVRAGSTIRRASILTIVPQDPGQAGKDQSASLISFLAGHSVKAIRESGNKQARAEPFAAQWQSQNVEIVAGSWNRFYLEQMEQFPEGSHDDYVDASSTAFTEVVSKASNFNRWMALAS